MAATTERAILAGGLLLGNAAAGAALARRRLDAGRLLGRRRQERLWPGKVVTELSPAGDFWEAEPEHQDYLERYPNGYTCHFVRPQWKLQQQFLSSFSVPGRR